MRLSVRKAHVKEWITCIVITHMWQSWVEIEHYLIVYFKCIAMFEVTVL